MTERLDRIESLLLAMAERQNEMNASLQQTNVTLDRVAGRQERHEDEIDTLLGAVSTNEVGVRSLVEQMSESNRRFDILRAEAAADRQRSDEQMSENNRRFDTLRAEAAADRQRSDERFSELRAEAAADRQRSDEHFDELRTEAIARQARSDQRFEAQLAEIRAQGEQIRALLSALATTNGRVDSLEQTS